MAQLSAENMIVARLVQMVDAFGEVDPKETVVLLREHGFLGDDDQVNTERGRDALELAAALDAA